MKALPLRFPPSVEARVKALVEPIAADKGYEAMRVSVSMVLRMALLEGLGKLEEIYLPKGKS